MTQMWGDGNVAAIENNFAELLRVERVQHIFSVLCLAFPHFSPVKNDLPKLATRREKCVE